MVDVGYQSLHLTAFVGSCCKVGFTKGVGKGRQFSREERTLMTELHWKLRPSTPSLLSDAAGLFFPHSPGEVLMITR